MNAVLSLILLVVVVPLVLNEAGELAPWLARRLVCWTANRLGTPEARERYGEEWLGNLEHVPGKLTKLLWALGLLYSVPRLRWQAIRRERRKQAELGKLEESNRRAAWLRASRLWLDRGPSKLVPTIRWPEPWVVDRPAEVNQIVAALCRKSEGTPGITTAVQGAGGSGKTTIAKIVGADRRVLRKFRGRVYWVTIGQDACRESLASLVNGLIVQLAPDRAVTFTDARQAGDYLAAVLAMGPPRLVVLDDVWTDEQLAAFPVAGRCARLVTTRIPSLVPARAVPVRVDQMSQEQALALLQAGLPQLSAEIAADLVEETGRSPLPLRQINKILAHCATVQLDVSTLAEELLGRLRAGGTQLLDELAGVGSGRTHISDPDRRCSGIRATIQASVGLLSPSEHHRLAELAVFAEDETIPVALIAMLWKATGRLGQVAAGALCARLADLALLDLAPDGGMVTMHDAIRDYLIAELGDEPLTRLHQTLLDEVSAGLPVSSTSADGSNVVAWWEFSGPGRDYLRHHLIGHLVSADRSTEADTVSADPLWMAACQ